MAFTELAMVTREQGILPDKDLVAIERHAIGISEHRAELIAAGQHVKGGLLLYGPPGTGKTHTVAYLLNQMTDRTTVILSGAAVDAVGQAGSIARALQPATIIIEDVSASLEPSLDALLGQSAPILRRSLAGSVDSQ